MVDRRQFLQLAVFGVMALPLVGCGGPAGSVSKVASETLAVAYPDLQPSLDPHNWTAPAGPRTFAPLFDALTFVQNDGQLRPALAVAWSQPNPTTWQFRLRVDDAKFHNGEMFSPDSVKLTLERLLDPASTLPVRALVSTIDRLDVIDAWTINIATKAPDRALARRLSLVYMLPPQYFAQVGEQGFAQHPIGTGFWMLDTFEPSRRLSLKLFRDTWRGARGEDPPPLSNLEITVLPQPADRAQALRSRELDVATALDSASAQALKNAGFAVQTADLGHANRADFDWETAAFGAPLWSGADVTATAANVQGVVAEPNGSWWFDRVTKTALQRVAVAGGA